MTELDLGIAAIPLRKLAEVIAIARGSCLVLLEISKCDDDELHTDDVAILRDTGEPGARLHVLRAVVIALRKQLADAERALTKEEQRQS